MEEVTLEKIMNFIVIAYNASTFLQMIYPILAGIMDVWW